MSFVGIEVGKPCSVGLDVCDVVSENEGESEGIIVNRILGDTVGTKDGL